MTKVNCLADLSYLQMPAKWLGLKLLALYQNLFNIITTPPNVIIAFALKLLALYIYMQLAITHSYITPY